MERLSAEFALDIEWRPYELHPEIPPEGITPRQLFGSRRRGDDYMGMLREEGEKESLDIKPPQRIANSAVSLEAAEFARDQGEEAFACLHRALFKAYFSHGLDIGDRKVVVPLAAECGLDGDQLVVALKDGRYKDRVRESIEWARRSAITGTPTFIFDERFVLVGAQSYDVFQKVTERILQKRAEGYPDD